MQQNRKNAKGGEYFKALYACEQQAHIRYKVFFLKVAGLSYQYTCNNLSITKSLFDQISHTLQISHYIVVNQI